LFASGVTEAGCLAHARRKFHELWANHKSPVGEQALALFGKLYDVEREIAHHDPEELASSAGKAKPIADALHMWLTGQRQKVPRDPPQPRRSITAWVDGPRWCATSMTHACPRTTTGWRTRSVHAIGRSNWLFEEPACGQARRGRHEPAPLGQAEWPRPYAYLRNVLDRLPTQPASRIAELLPHRWSPSA
jgi:hypothetical protein